MPIKEDLYHYLSEHLEHINPGQPARYSTALQSADDESAGTFTIHVRGPVNRYTATPVNVKANLMIVHRPDAPDNELDIELGYHMSPEELQKAPWLMEDHAQISKPFHDALYDLARRADLEYNIWHAHNHADRRKVQPNTVLPEDEHFTKGLADYQEGGLEGLCRIRCHTRDLESIRDAAAELDTRREMGR